MDLVTTWEQVEANFRTLERYRNSPDYCDTYANLIKRGICFVAFSTNGRTTFAPSRFIGYVGNTAKAHDANEERDGRVTNRALSVILGGKPEVDDHLEALYTAFCSEIGIVPSSTGAFGKKRKYWLR